MSETNEICHIPWHETFSCMLVHELELKKWVFGSEGWKNMI